MTLEHRLTKFRTSNGAGNVLVLRMEDIRWLTGFTGGTGQLVVGAQDGDAWLLVDGRYHERAVAEVTHSGAPVTVVPVTGGTSFDDAIGQVMQGRGLRVDGNHLTAAHFSRLQSLFDAEVGDVALDDLRRIKDDDEIETMARAALIADAALQAVVADGIAGRTEKQVRNRLDQLMREHGADGVGFDTIVATGVNGARPHHEPTDTIISDGDAVVIDMGAEVDGYRSDMTRTIRVGEWSDDIRKIYDVVVEAQAAGVASLRAGVLGSDIDAAVRLVFAREGLEHEYLHGTGHGVGLYIHEQPILSPRCTAVLAANEVVTVEPGLYRYGVGGVRIEDQVVVTGTGCRTLTLSPKELSCPRSQRMT